MILLNYKFIAKLLAQLRLLHNFIDIDTWLIQTNKQKKYRAREDSRGPAINIVARDSAIYLYQAFRGLTNKYPRPTYFVLRST